MICPSSASATRRSGLVHSLDDVDTETNAASDGRHYGNKALKSAATWSETGQSSAASTRTNSSFRTGTTSDRISGLARTTRNLILNNSTRRDTDRGSNTGFAKEGAVQKDIDLKIKQRMAREQRRRQEQEDRAALDSGSSDDSGDDEAPY